MPYSLDLDALTVIRTASSGEVFDLNADGEPCENAEDLRAFVIELHAQGAYTAEVRDGLLAEIA